MKRLRWDPEVLISHPNNFCILLKKNDSIGMNTQKIIFSLCLRVAPYYHIISETKCDRDKPFFSAERGGQLDCAKV